VSVTAPRAARPAGFWIRALAAVIDAVVVALVQFSMGAVAGAVWGRDVDASASVQALVGLFTLLFTLVYATALHSLAGQTVGKMVTGIRVVGVDGELLGPGAAFLRWVATLASAVPFMMGFVMAGLRGDKRALHDLIAGSRVERLPGRERAAPRAAHEEPPAPGAAV